MDYRDYQHVRDAAWRILLDCKADRLPINLNAICHKLSIRVFSYSKGGRMIERAELRQVVRRTDGMTFFAGVTPVILFDEKKPP